MSIDYDAVLKIPEVVKALEIADGVDRDDEDSVNEWIDSTLDADGKDVFELATEIACNTVKKWHGKYYLFASEYEPEGPFDSIQEAMTCDAIFGAEYDEFTLSTSELTEEETKELALGLTLDGGTVIINDTQYTVINGKMTKDNQPEQDEE